MSGAWWSGERSRKIVSRLVVEGDLVLQTPAHFSNGDTDELVDMPLLVDPLDGRTPLLNGASIAGALRSYLREREHGYSLPPVVGSVSNLLFGAQKKKGNKDRDDEEGEQSPLIIDDSLGKNFGIEFRQGVSIDTQSRTARGRELFDLQLWKAGTSFPLRFELVIKEGDDEEELKKALATALEGFNNGSITLGARKRRGYGRVFVNSWRVKKYDLATAQGLLDWIEKGNKPLANIPPVTDIKEALGVNETLPDKRRFFRLEATFSLEGSLLIRSGSGKDNWGPDMFHICAKQTDGSIKPVLPGTSAGGALRARALKIANTLAANYRGETLINSLFGPKMEGNKKPQASRVIVSESVIEGGRTDLVQSRVAIDRFTGGALETALYNEQPVFGGEDTLISIDLFLMNPEKYEIGLLLLLLKDLWTGDLPLGGEAGIGRGRLRGKKAFLELREVEGGWKCNLESDAQKLKIDQNFRNILESYVNSLKEYLEEENG